MTLIGSVDNMENMGNLIDIHGNWHSGNWGKRAIDIPEIRKKGNWHSGNWESGKLRIWKIGKLRFWECWKFWIWVSGKLGIWDSGKLGIWDYGKQHLTFCQNSAWHSLKQHLDISEIKHSTFVEIDVEFWNWYLNL